MSGNQRLRLAMTSRRLFRGKTERLEPQTALQACSLQDFSLEGREGRLARWNGEQRDEG